MEKHHYFFHNLDPPSLASILPRPIFHSLCRFVLSSCIRIVTNDWEIITLETTGYNFYFNQWRATIPFRSLHRYRFNHSFNAPLIYRYSLIPYSKNMENAIEFSSQFPLNVINLLRAKRLYRKNFTVGSYLSNTNFTPPPANVFVY